MRLWLFSRAVAKRVLLDVARRLMRQEWRMLMSQAHAAIRRSSADFGLPHIWNSEDQKDSLSLLRAHLSCMAGCICQEDSASDERQT